MIQQTKNKLRQLRLPGMLRAYDALVAGGTHREQSIDELLAHLVDAECDERYARKVQRLLKRARLRYSATWEQVDFTFARGLDRTVMSRLYEGTWIEKTQNVLLLGPTGVGKSFLACALGHRACMLEQPTRYWNVRKLFGELRAAQADNSVARVIKNIARQRVLILDDFGLDSFTSENRRWLLEIFEDRYGLSSTVVVTQLPVKTWAEVIGDRTLAEAILDRLVHNAHKLVMQGESYRGKKGEVAETKPV